MPVLTSVSYGVSAMLLNRALLDGVRVTAIEYVWVVTPSWAVTTVVMVVVDPTAPNVIGPDAIPEVTAILFTVTFALGSFVVGVTVTDAVVLLTDAV